ncbi:glycoside hydrolase family 17 protein [Botryobasidium botryosum FD-172 SS1]|uniref:glucan endo-1,3-beta-D-glucosidase n=1 Tax=Botryobasidium botryosum (strain FD-172 SS1) TaxID=930990 RepID=A0A067N0C7_BOTB1|nr:glycoside hydrolase family 17 protein [Botryobasidium botryosum FD-172 SS1]
MVLSSILFATAALAAVSLGTPVAIVGNQVNTTAASGCFPAIGFTPPSGTPTTPVASWWCNEQDEQGFYGFSYAVNDCPSATQIAKDFTRMRKDFNARYVRIYAACDTSGFYDRIITAAYNAGIGVYAVIWFGFDGTNEWMGRRDALINTVKNNPLARYVIRSIDVGSEPLYDWVLSPKDLAAQVTNVKNQVGTYGVKVSISEMQYGYTVQGDSKAVLNAIDAVHAHQIPFFDGDAKDGGNANAWNSVSKSTSWFVSNTASSKKIIFTQTGWPSNSNIWKPNSASAVASVASEQAFFNLLDTRCADLKAMTPKGGVGWFWQIWSDPQLDGWGALDWNGNPKFKFAPKTSC